MELSKGEDRARELARAVADDLYSVDVPCLLRLDRGKFKSPPNRWIGVVKHNSIVVLAKFQDVFHCISSVDSISYTPVFCNPNTETPKLYRHMECRSIQQLHHLR